MGYTPFGELPWGPRRNNLDSFSTKNANAKDFVWWPHSLPHTCNQFVGQPHPTKTLRAGAEPLPPVVFGSPANRKLNFE